MARAVKFTGDFAKLNKWIKRIDNTPKVLAVIADNLAEESLDLIKDGFRAETDPDGVKWPKLKYRKGKILQDTARMRNSFHRKRVSKTGFVVGPAVTYAQFHQHGTARGIPVRRMVPRGNRLPPKWKRRFVETASEVLEAHYVKG